MKEKDLKRILTLHNQWVNSAQHEGKRADLRGASLCGANLCGADLRGANLRDANLCGANLRGANLRGANLCGANLCGADLRGANLINATGNCREIKTVQTDIWVVTYTDELMAIGCKQYSLVDWLGFSDQDISEMDGQALNFWNKWKPILAVIGVFDGVEI